MDTLILIAAGALLVIAISFIFVGPFMIGRTHSEPTFTAADYFMKLFRWALTIVVIGRVFGWW